MILQKQKIRNFVFTGKYKKEYDRYSTYLHQKTNLIEDTIDWRLQHIRGFLEFLEHNKIKISEIEALDVYHYMDTILDLSDKTREHRAYCIKFFLNHLFNNNKIKMNGEDILDNIKCPSGKNVISFYINEEVKKLTLSIDTSTPRGKRDYALIILFISYGLRVKDVRMLTFKNINWIENKIIIRQHKDNEINEFPLIEEVKYALLDYCKNSRPNYESEYIFITSNGKTISRQCIYHLVEKYFKLANINTVGKQRGPHSLRHSLGTSLLNEGNGLKEISSVLGHNNLNTTKEYAKVNLSELKKMSLEVPKWNN